MPTPEEVLEKFNRVKLRYSSRNSTIDSLQEFFDGNQWETENSSKDMRIVLNYTRESVLYHVGYLSRSRPRVDVPSKTDSPRAQSRENYLNTILDSIWKLWPQMEMDANKFGYAVLQLLWDAEPVRKKSVDGISEFDVIDKMPFRSRIINPKHFYPNYRTFDHPNDFLWVVRHDPNRLVDDIAERYNVRLQPTNVDEQCDLVEFWDSNSYILIALTKSKSKRTQSFVVLANEKHPYGRPPFFVLPNLIDPHRDFTAGGGISEIESIMDAAKHLNLIYTLSATEIVSKIHPPALYKADGTHSQSPADIRLGAGDIIPLRADEDVQPLHWPGIPSSVIEHRNSTMAALRDMAKLPRTSFGESSFGATSGIGMRLMYEALEITLSLKVPIRQSILEEMLSWALNITKQQLGENGKIQYLSSNASGVHDITLFKRDIEDSHCVVTFNVTPPRDKITYEQHVAYLYKLNLISLRTALEMLDDIRDPEAEIRRLKLELKDSLLHPERAAVSVPQQQHRPEMGDSLEGVKAQEAPPVPALPSMPSKRNVPFLERGLTPNMNTLGVNQGPPIEEQP